MLFSSSHVVTSGRFLCIISLHEDDDFDSGPVFASAEIKSQWLILQSDYEELPVFVDSRSLLWTKAVVTQVPTVVKIFGSVCQAGRTRYNTGDTCICFGSK